jgi:hypothetical protein
MSALIQPVFASLAVMCGAPKWTSELLKNIQTVITPGIRTVLSLNTANSYKCTEALGTCLATRYLIT